MRELNSAFSPFSIYVSNIRPTTWIICRRFPDNFATSSHLDLISISPGIHLDCIWIAPRSLSATWSVNAGPKQKLRPMRNKRLTMQIPRHVGVRTEPFLTVGVENFVELIPAPSGATLRGRPSRRRFTTRPIGLPPRAETRTQSTHVLHSRHTFRRTHAHFSAAVTQINRNPGTHALHIHTHAHKHIHFSFSSHIQLFHLFSQRECRRSFTHQPTDTQTHQSLQIVQVGIVLWHVLLDDSKSR